MRGESARKLEILAPTALEYAAVRLMAGGERCRRAGVGADETAGPSSLIIVCGLAGALSAAYPPGTVVVPDTAGDPQGRRYPCDPALSGALRRGAAGAGFLALGGSLLTAPGIVAGAERKRWAAEGFDLADMETAHLAAGGARVAGLRVVLDAPGRELSPAWLTPVKAARSPALWPEAARLAIDGPRYALRAGLVLRHALPYLREVV